MDFFERLFGISPDGGNGMSELLYGMMLVLILCMVLFRCLVSRLKRKLRCNRRALKAYSPLQ